MCTASWFYTGDSYHLFFNRDELRSRAIAREPQALVIGDRNTLLPIDPDGGGTWIGVNDQGWSFALLNFYQGQIPSGELISRGSIVKGALACRSAVELDHYLASLPLSRHAPFSLLCLAPPTLPNHALPTAQQPEHNKILMCRWDGSALQRSQRKTLITSSSRNFDEVVTARGNTAHGLHQRDGGPVNAQQRSARHREFHHSHGDSRSALSVCMHRSDARTVSYSEITVRPGFASFHYYAGSPCETQTPSRHELSWSI